MLQIQQHRDDTCSYLQTRKHQINVEGLSLNATRRKSPEPTLKSINRVADSWWRNSLHKAGALRRKQGHQLRIGHITCNFTPASRGGSQLCHTTSLLLSCDQWQTAWIWQGHQPPPSATVRQPYNKIGRKMDHIHFFLFWLLELTKCWPSHAEQSKYFRGFASIPALGTARKAVSRPTTFDASSLRPVLLVLRRFVPCLGQACWACLPFMAFWRVLPKVP